MDAVFPSKRRRIYTGLHCVTFQKDVTLRLKIKVRQKYLTPNNLKSTGCTATFIQIQVSVYGVYANARLILYNYSSEPRRALGTSSRHTAGSHCSIVTLVRVQ
jgi:hypothetical protein